MSKASFKILLNRVGQTYEQNYVNEELTDTFSAIRERDMKKIMCEEYKKKHITQKYTFVSDIKEATHLQYCDQ